MSNLPPQKFREIVLQALYSQDISKANESNMVNMLSEELSVTKNAVRLAFERVKEVMEKTPEIDALITAASKEYEFDRIQTVERNVLRLGVFEMLYDDNIPEKVAIAEALRLTNKFGSPESVSFVNAILDNIYKSQK